MSLQLTDQLDLLDGNSIVIQNDDAGYLRIYILTGGQASSKLALSQAEVQKLLRKLNGAFQARLADIA